MADAATQPHLLSQPTSAVRQGLVYGFAGMAAFSLTLPATRAAVAELDPTVVGLGRAIVAAALAAVALAAAGQRIPDGATLKRLAIVALGVVVGFPWLSAWALQFVPSVHGAVVIGLLPLSTAVFAAVWAGERPSALFWVATVAGSAAVVGYALAAGGGTLHLADLALLGAVIAAGVGYAEGARLARVLGGWQVISWALVIAAPVLAIPVGLAIHAHGLSAGVAAWTGFAWVSLVSMYLGFFLWYRGLVLGGIARVGQLQLLQPFLTIAASAALLGERVSPAAIVAALVVVVCVAIGRRARIG
jgi:drug/metabolite transporter (DMT)-like permease